MTLAATTKIEAINTMLSVIGEAPVSSIGTNATGDVAIAKNILDEVLKEVQSRGWYWNTEFKVNFAKDTEGNIAVPGNVARVVADPTVSSNHYSVRNGLLYDLTEHTSVFTDDVSLTAIYFLEWEELPEVGKRFVMIKAGRVFQDRVLSSPQLNAFTLRDEMIALADLKNAEMEVSDFSIFDNAGTFNTINRSSPLDSLRRY